jgi:5-methylcytosine-specific restriction endonuclease McrA
MSDVLMLNADFSPFSVAPLSTLSWKDAVKLVWLDQVKILEHYDDWFVHSPSVTIQVPSIVVSKEYVKTSRRVKFNKNNLVLRDEFTCQYCIQEFDKNSLTMEHVIPRSRGGKTSWENVCMACSKCNSAKGNKLIKPIKQPARPSFGELLTKAKQRPLSVPHESWIYYVGWPQHLVKVVSPLRTI